MLLQCLKKIMETELKKLKLLKEKLCGPVQTIFVPFNKNRKIDYSSLKNHIKKLCNLEFVNSLYLMPYNGRYSQLSEKEILNLNKFCIKEVKKRDKIIIVSDPLHASTETKLKFCLHAKKHGADLFSSICREKYFSDKQIYLHYKKLCSAKIPLLVHLMPFLSGYNGNNMVWKDTTIKKISQLKNIIAIKEDTKSISFAKKILKNYKKRFVIIFAARKNFLIKLKNYGLKSYLNGSSVIDSQIDEIFWHYYNLNMPLAKKFVKDLDNPFWDISVKKYGWHRVNKACLEVNTIMKRYERLPMISLSSSDYKNLKKEVIKLKAKLKIWSQYFNEN